MRYAVLVVVVLALLVSGLPATPLAQAQSCRFVLGFATLHDLIPQIVGECLDNETHNPENGDGLQMTTNGLMVWRKADNFTAFTNGFQSWVNGPFGVQTRLDSQRLFWEGNPEELAIVPPPVEGQQCHTAQLSLSIQDIEPGAGRRFATLAFTNNADAACTVFGFPGTQLLDAQNNPLPTNVVRDGDFFPNAVGPSRVVIPPGGTRTFLMLWSVIPTGNETSCPRSSKIAVIPPNEWAPIVIPAEIQACNGGELAVSAVQP